MFVERIGGVAPLLVPGRHFVIHGRDGDVHAVGGRKPTHIIPVEDRDKAPALHEQFLDIGAGDRAGALARVAVGDPVTFTPDFIELSAGVVATQALDDRGGLYAMIRALELYAEEPGAARLTGLATVHEETTFMGARALALRLRPDVVIVLDGDFCSDTPAADAKELAGEVKLGAGPVLSRGAGSSERLVALAREVAAAEGLAVQIKAYPGETETDADELMAAGAAATLTVGLPHAVHALALRGRARRRPRDRGAPGRRPGAAHRRGAVRMKLFIAIDLEGISGVVCEADTAREGAAAQRARAHMRADLDAVLEGCAAAGAGEVVVCDAHDDGRNLDPTGLPGSVTLMSGSPAPLSMVEGLAPDCDGALFVGYHARAGTAAAVLEHTWNYKVFGAAVGDLEVGEFGVAALLAGEFGVPALYVSGDDKTAAEARALVPGIATTVVKTGVRREAAALCSPEEARARMRADVEAALRADPWPAPLAWNGEPLRLTFTRVQFCDLAEACPGTTRLDGRTLEIAGASFAEVYAGFLACLRLSELEG